MEHYCSLIEIRSVDFIRGISDIRALVSSELDFEVRSVQLFYLR